MKNENPASIEIAQTALAFLGQDKRILVLDTESKDALTYKVSIAYESARKQVLADHNWNFARTEAFTRSTPVRHDYAYPWSTPMPPDSLRILAVYAEDGRKAQYIRYEHTLRSTSPLSRVVYVRDEEDMTEWSEAARRAFVFRLAADIAKPVTGRINEAQLQEAHYTAAIEAAKLQEAREGEAANPWGSSHHAEKMWGGNHVSIHTA